MSPSNTPCIIRILVLVREERRPVTSTVLGSGLPPCCRMWSHAFLLPVGASAGSCTNVCTMYVCWCLGRGTRGLVFWTASWGADWWRNQGPRGNEEKCGGAHIAMTRRAGLMGIKSISCMGAATVRRTHAGPVGTSRCWAGTNIEVIGQVGNPILFTASAIVGDHILCTRRLVLMRLLRTRCAVVQIPGRRKESRSCREGIRSGTDARFKLGVV